MRKERLGIYGGSFSPPHRGHIRAAEAFYREMKLDRLLIMPANIPPHKQIKGGVPAEARYELCCTAFDGMCGIETSNFEIKRDGVSYTVDTLRHFSAEERELYLLCGDDMFLTLDTWREPQEIFRLAVIVSMRRYDEGAERLRAKGEEYREKYGARVCYIDTPPFPVSSTQVRELIFAGADTAEYLSDDVRKAIDRLGLYGSNGHREEENNG